MNKELIIMKMQKPARVLATVMKVLYILTAVGAVLGALGFASMYAMKETMIETMTNPAVEQTAEIEETLALLDALDLSTTVLACVFTILAAGFSFVTLFLAARLFREISEERATLMRESYAGRLKLIALFMFGAPIIDLIFSVIVALNGNLSLLMGGESVSESGSLWFAVILLVASFIWKYAAMLHEVREQELREEYENLSKGESIPLRMEEIFREEATEEAREEAEENRTFEGF